MQLLGNVVICSLLTLCCLGQAEGAGVQLPEGLDFGALGQLAALLGIPSAIPSELTLPSTSCFQLLLLSTSVLVCIRQERRPALLH